MTTFDAPRAFGEFAVMLGVCVVWLLISYAIPPLRRRPKVSYGIAMALAIGLALIPIGGPNANSVAASATLVALLWGQMVRATRQLGQKAAVQQSAAAPPG